MKPRIGIYGGTFNPIHLGHTRAARAFLYSGMIDELYVIPAGTPPHKDIDREDDPELRLRMTQLAFSEFPEYGKSLFVSDYEIKNPGKSYTVQTLRHFSQYSDDITVLCGTDMFLCLDSWYMPEEIFRRAKILCARREDDPETDEKLRRKAGEYKRLFGANVGFLGLFPYEISSSEIRKIISSGGDTSEYLSPVVADYIKDRNLYLKK